eukprot:GHVR01086934.1.p1 GENE.GHVR01086934.1~~GHVR01086934.1.p1  ORF type:complete len:248 (+),score=50.20 GHVR01086934.1:61-804(+)
MENLSDGVDSVDMSIDIIATCCSCIVFSTIQFILPSILPKYKKNINIDWQNSSNINKIISTLHAVSVSTLAWWGLYISPYNIWSTQGWGKPFSRRERLISNLSLGYFIFDMIYSIVWEKSYDIALHHISVCYGLITALYLNISSKEMLMCMSLTEMSTPFLNIRNLTKSYRKKNKFTIFELSSWVFGLVFLVVRIVLGPFVVVNTLYNDNPFAVKQGAFLVQVLSIWWMGRIAKGAWKNITTSHKDA